jgi:hypothetical protein
MPEQSLTLFRRSTLVGIVLLMVTAATSEFWMGRRLWGTSGIPGLWSGDIWSSHNSQFLADPYSFTHITHGILLYALMSVLLDASPLSTRLLVTVALESLWEVIENTNTVIQRYRTATISLNYYGDSIANSMGDILACALGFLLASRLPPRVTIAGALALEILLLIWTRDNLTLNVIMLIHPMRALTLWQLGK